MRALELRGDKGIDSIVYTTERPIPVPENDEILVQVKAVEMCIRDSCYAGNENSHGHKFHQK